VFFDTLLKGMEDKEVEAILAHELGHFHHQHIRKQIIISFLTSLIGLALSNSCLREKALLIGSITKLNMGIVKLNNTKAA
jgi:Zn-dependent protease with chaperone function